MSNIYIATIVKISGAMNRRDWSWLHNICTKKNFTLLSTAIPSMIILDMKYLIFRRVCSHHDRGGTAECGWNNKQTYLFTAASLLSLLRRVPLAQELDCKSRQSNWQILVGIENLTLILFLYTPIAYRLLAGRQQYAYYKSNMLVQTLVDV